MSEKTEETAERTTKNKKTGNENLSEGKHISEEGQHISENRRKNRMILKEGTFLANAKGFGFVSVDDMDQDLFIPEGSTGTALDGDVVEVRFIPGTQPSNGHQEAEVVRVVTRNTTTIVGTFYGKKGIGSVIPDNRKIPTDVRILPGKTLGAVNGHKVVVRITDYGNGTSGSHGGGKHPFGEHTPLRLTGEIIEILGHMDDPGVDILSIMRAYNLPQDFPEDVKEEVRNEISQEISLAGVRLIPAEEEPLKDCDAASDPAADSQISTGNTTRQNDRSHQSPSKKATAEGRWVRHVREDWRDVLTVTIDGPDTKDIDDAISIRRIRKQDGNSAIGKQGDNHPEMEEKNQEEAEESTSDVDSVLNSRAGSGKNRNKKAGKSRNSGNAVWELGVHIADVSQYVKENSPLDKEALKRATSNYLVDRVIPMLPHELSNGICSLNPGEDRFALSCIMQLDRTGRIVDSRVAETVIRSDAKLSYPGVMKLFEEGDETELLNQLEAQAEGKPYEEIVRKLAEISINPDSQIDTILTDTERGEHSTGKNGEDLSEEDGNRTPESSFSVENDKKRKGASKVRGYSRGVATKAHKLAAMLRQGRRLSGLISKRRMAEGAIDFEFPECKILLDDQGRVTDIVPYERNEATMMIENFMVAANETVAQTFYWLGVPFVYRTHGVPDEEKMRNLQEFVRNYGYSFKWKQGDIHPKELQTMLAKVAGKPEEATIAVMTLRSMQRAVYSTECGGHFGLALRYYCHFTSPIRRYPDLQIHRIIKEYLHGKLNDKRRAHYESILPAVCRQSSNMERRADEAERETDKQKMCEYMKGRLGEVFEGTIDGVTGRGFYVQLPNTVEGLVPVRSLRDDYYDYDESTARLIGERTGKHYNLGQKVKVSVASVDTAARTIDFELLTDKKARKVLKKKGPVSGDAGEAHKKVKHVDRNGNDADHRPVHHHHHGHRTH